MRSSISSAAASSYSGRPGSANRWAAASALDPAAFPETIALADELSRHPGDGVFASGLRWILDGLDAEGSGS